MRGKLVREGASKIFAATPLQAEAMAVLLAISDFDSYVGNVRIRSDSELLVKGFLNRQDAANEIKPTIDRIKSLASRFTSCSLTKVPRKCVYKAHELAQQARKGP